tara:strand:+ start:28 stop:1614 length:1587 start_codon:yes stop_codon:yes gene_type:complete
MSYPLSKQQILKEIVQCGKDPVYFLNNYAKISHPMHGLIPFRTYNFQDDLLNDFNDHRFNVILKARQLGISTITAGYVVWMMLFHRDKNVLVMATKFGTAANLVKKVKNIMRHLPKWIKIANISVDNRTSFELSNGSQIKASSTSSDAGRSEALSLLVIDEAAHVEGLDELWTGLYPTLSTGGRCIALSTPNGVGNWFHQTYVGAEEQTNDFYPTKLPWDVHPDRDYAWFENETKNMSRRQIAQELECNFNMSGETVIHSDDILKIENAVESPHHRAGFDRNLWLWEEFNPEHSYLLVADVARGDGRDYSAFHVINITEMRQVAEYQGKVELDMYAMFLADIGKQFGNAMIVVENNNVGYAVLTKLEDMAYSNVYYSTKGTHQYLDSYQARNNSSAVLGFTTSMKTRPLIIAKLEEFVRNDLITVKSSRLLNELKTFVWNNGKPEAMRGYNDDLVMSLAIACWVRDTALVSNQRDTEYRKAFLNSMTSTKSTLNTKIPGMIGYSGTKYDNDIDQTRDLMNKFPGLFKG